MKKFDHKDIGYFGKPITSLSREELLEALEELAAILYECSAKNRKIEDYIFINKNDEDRIIFKIEGKN